MSILSEKCINYGEFQPTYSIVWCVPHVPNATHTRMVSKIIKDMGTNLLKLLATTL